ncbi:MAG: ABC transporter permease, partial [Chloroflexota bacterium]
MQTGIGWRALGAVAATLVVVVLAVPLAALLWRALEGGALGPALGSQLVAQALQLSLLTSAASLTFALLCGTPLAYGLARWTFPGRGLVDALVDVPVVLPPAVAGIALLMAFGRRGVLGAPLAEVGISLAFTPWAVVLAQCFVAVPFYVRAARTGFAGVDRDLEGAARVDGAT